MFVRAGGVIPMLAPDVYTLAEHGDDPSIVRWVDRADQLHLFAFPRGSTQGRFYESGSYESVEAPGRWRLRIEDVEPRTVYLQASLATLEEPFEPCVVELGGRELDEAEWRYDADSGVLRACFDRQGGTLEVRGC